MRGSTKQNTGSEDSTASTAALQTTVIETLSDKNNVAEQNNTKPLEIRRGTAHSGTASVR